MDDRQIVDLYWAREERAISETEKKYGRYCHYIAYQILCNDADAEEIVNDTYLKAWHTMPENRPASLKAYVGMLTRQLSFNAYERSHAEKRGGAQTPLVLEELAACIPDGDGREDIGESVALGESLDRFVRALPERKRQIFVRRYFYTSAVSEIADEYGMSQNHVNVVLLQLRKRLKKHLQQEGF